MSQKTIDIDCRKCGTINKVPTSLIEDRYQAEIQGKSLKITCEKCEEDI